MATRSQNRDEIMHTYKPPRPAAANMLYHVLSIPLELADKLLVDPMILALGYFVWLVKTPQAEGVQLVPGAEAHRCIQGREQMETRVTVSLHLCTAESDALSLISVQLDSHSTVASTAPSAPERSLYILSRPGVAQTLRTLRLPLNEISEQSADVIEASFRVQTQPLFPRTFDLVVSGGGLCGFYGGTMTSVLGSLKRRGVLQVNKLYGVSSGALVCACYLGCESGFTKPTDIYRCYQIFAGSSWISQGMRQFLDEVLPPNVHKVADGRMFITVTEYRSGCLPRRRTVSSFPTRNFFLDTILASSILPPVTLDHLYRP
eukprot:CAMPEP_0119329928 /NCGR_PEP_ID=MMETSP1333-20130426/77059_1 /TAXON_ID=418940 /ORGANISM="Scyphosphaera apsteinii, Strain RCC1455" /LENGTH=317 /DNA_ID=CAMNT_0007339179 /DNA_START=120 /DNA_END=1069 /DNA_ORIENTATION=-